MSVEEADLISDPHTVPVTFSNIMLGGGLVNGVINFTLGVFRFTPTTDGKIHNDPIICSRIRLDRDTAITLRDFLNHQIALLDTPQDKAN
ncbi:hypothetical protein GFB56_12410 [Ensifer sp. T173]|uniref:Uncharacterized protein n=1 Tax=Ensifer canadensis TaxID=555315 RepID=A0AAW4FHP3_9HYPH|nr:hypothetical protein [Ensifer canadensis]MBM3091617.1 hypothetical protein [Ensifer canadensis]UBI74398.1 hypothetical protein J3R84_12950 [Ensifer canadensis]